jgi:hypothetical protein
LLIPRGHARSSLEKRSTVRAAEEVEQVCSSVRPLRFVPLIFSSRTISHPAAWRAAR